MVLCARGLVHADRRSGWRWGWRAWRLRWATSISGWLQLHVGQTCSLLAAAHRRTHTQILRLCSLLQACRAHGELLQDIVVKMIADNYRTLRDSSAVLHRLARRRERCGEASNQQEMCRHPHTNGRARGRVHERLLARSEHDVVVEGVDHARAGVEQPPVRVLLFRELIDNYRGGGPAAYTAPRASWPSLCACG